MRVLVVDDSRAMRGILKRMLGGLGHEVVEAANGREAIDRLRAGEVVQLVLVDWNMPEMNGYEFVQAARREPALASLPIIMVTTETEMDRVAMALEAGVNEYVMKPFTADVLVDKLALLGLAGSAA